MRPGTLQLTGIIGGWAFAILAGVIATRAPVRSFIGSFLAPVPLASASASVPGPSTLPTELVLPGVESRELAKLAAAPEPGPPRATREALFPAAALAAAPRAPERVSRLRRPEMVGRDDSRIDDAVTFLSQDAHAHAAFLATYQRSGRYRPVLDRILRAWKVPEDVIAVVFVENGFSPASVQRDGSAGLWSLPLDVASAYGLTTRETYDERRSVEASSEAAGRYLSDLRERFGSWALALYAFAHGYKRTVAELAKERSVRFEDLVDTLAPADRAYVFQVFAVATVLANPERFGLDSVHQDPALATSDMEVPGQAPFAVIAQAAGTTVSRLHELNPEYLSDTVPATGNAMIVHLPREGLARAKELITPLLYAPPGTLSSQVGRVAEASDASVRAHGAKERGRKDGAGSDGPKGPEASAVPPSYYRVHDGDTLDAIAHRFGVAREAIASDNALDPTAALVTGQLLRLRSQDANPAGGR
jgi:membrane-bound lytic murein transglycosylase D